MHTLSLQRQYATAERTAPVNRKMQQVISCSNVAPSCRGLSRPVRMVPRPSAQSVSRQSRSFRRGGMQPILCSAGVAHPGEVGTFVLLSRLLLACQLLECVVSMYA